MPETPEYHYDNDPEALRNNGGSFIVHCLEGENCEYLHYTKWELEQLPTDVKVVFPVFQKFVSEDGYVTAVRADQIENFIKGLSRIEPV